MVENYPVWFIICALGAGSFGLRFLFLGIVGNRALPDWLMRHLRYTAVAVIPALVAPLVIWPDATSGQTDATRVIAALWALICGYISKSLYIAMAAGTLVMLIGVWWPY